VKTKRTTKAPSSARTRLRQPLQGVRGPTGIAALRSSAATLISHVAVPRARRSAAGSRTTSVPVLLIEDNRLLRDGLSALLGAQGLKVVATAHSGGEALRQVVQFKPQLVLLDATLGDRDGLRLVEAIKKASPASKLIVMHLLPVHEDIVSYVRAGVSGFIMKDASVAEFVAAIRAVADGARVLPPPVTKTLFSFVADRALARGKRGQRAATRMTAREREVTGLIAAGLGNREIGTRLRIAAHTVKSHVHNILEKLALHTRLEVAAYAHANGSRRRQV
jgi:DNA-binding NarL/FixJ family response regulator